MPSCAQTYETRGAESCCLPRRREPRHPRDRFLQEATLLFLHEVFAEVVAQLLKSVADGLRRWRVRIVPDGEIGPQGEQPGVQVAVLAEKVSENDGIDAS